jgi:hypothetical protein
MVIMNFDRLTAIFSSLPELVEQAAAAELADELAQLARERATLSPPRRLEPEPYFESNFWSGSTNHTSAAMPTTNPVATLAIS